MKIHEFTTRGESGEVYQEFTLSFRSREEAQKMLDAAAEVERFKREAQDARLIAAAPQLLEACERLLRKLKLSLPAVGVPCDCDDCLAVREADAAIRAAREGE